MGTDLGRAFLGIPVSSEGDRGKRCGSRGCCLLLLLLLLLGRSPHRYLFHHRLRNARLDHCLSSSGVCAGEMLYHSFPARLTLAESPCPTAHLLGVSRLSSVWTLAIVMVSENFKLTVTCTFIFSGQIILTSSSPS